MTTEVKLPIRRHGMTLLYTPGEGDILADVVFVHGLFGHPETTWTCAAPLPRTPHPRPVVHVQNGTSVGGPLAADAPAASTPPAELPGRATSSVSADPSFSSCSIAESSDIYHTASSPSATSLPLHNDTAREHTDAGGIWALIRWVFGGKDVNQYQKQAPSHLGSAVENYGSAPGASHQNITWPRDLLPSTLPKTRILTWGYDVDIVNAFSSAGQASVYQHARGLLNDLMNFRQSAAEKDRPIIFVAHSLGGIVVKDALSQSCTAKTFVKDVHPNTIGVCFLGTPHRGSGVASLGKVAFECSKALLQHPNIKVLRTLEVNSSELERIHTGFMQILSERKIQIHSCYEEYETRGTMVVQNFSFSIGDALETTCGIPANHSNMTKFTSASDTGFERVSLVLKRWIDPLDLKRETDAPRPKDPNTHPYTDRVRNTVFSSLQRSSFQTVEQLFDANDSRPEQKRQPAGIHWIGGLYVLKYHTATVQLTIEWNKSEDLCHPTINWQINTLESDMYPGSHEGYIRLRPKGNSTFPLDYRLQIMWLTPIFSPYINPSSSSLSSTGDLEDTMIFAPDAFTAPLQSIADFLLFGQFNDRGNAPSAPYQFHEMSGHISRYREKGKDAFTRAAAFFARAFTEPLPDALLNGNVGLGPGEETRREWRATSVLVISELLEFYAPQNSRLVAEAKMEYEKVINLRDWVYRDREWATRIAELCQFEFLVRAIARFHASLPVGV